MSQIALVGLALVMAALLALGVAAAMGLRRIAAAGSLVLCAGGTVLALAVLLAGAMPVALPIPLGPPGAAMTLAIDGLSGFFLLLVLLSGCAACAAALDDDGAGAAPFLPLLLGAMALTLLAADGFALVIGLELTALATFALLLAANEAAAARFELGMAVVAAACLVAALALLGDGAWGFAGMRAHATEGWRGVVVLALVLIGAGSRAGLAPVYAAVPGPAAALLSGVATKVALYVLIRVLFDLCEPAQPLWWGMPLLLLGAAGAVLGALRANLESDLQLILGWATIANTGLIVVGLGVGLAARAADLVPLEALALGAALLLALAHALFQSLLLLGAGAIETGAGTRRLERLGGLIRSMPVTTASMLAGAAALAALPPTSGFAGQWTLFQAVFGAPRAGGLGLQLLIAGIVALLALATVLTAAAAVRLVGVALLGRPRSPRAAAAVEAGAGARLAMTGLAVATFLVGLFPGAVLALAGPALRLLTGASMASRAGAVTIAVQADAPGYAAAAIAVLLGLAGALAAAVLRSPRQSGTHGVPAWECGAEPPPPWLPFGDPLTQYGGASMAQPLRRTLGAALKDRTDAALFRSVARARDRFSDFAERLSFPTTRHALTAIALTLLLVLFLVAVAERL
jgi:hydrogenase-4 component B